MKVSRELLEKYLEMWANLEYGVPFYIAKERSRGSKMEFENLYRMLIMFANDLEKEVDK